jgi:hypothetical protein
VQAESPLAARLPKASMTAAVCAGESTTPKLKSLVSFSGWRAADVVVVIMPVGPFFSITRARRPSYPFSTVS